MILLPSKCHGQAAIQIASVIGEPKKVSCGVFQVVRLSFADPIEAVQLYQTFADIAGGHLRDSRTIYFLCMVQPSLVGPTMTKTAIQRYPKLEV